MSSMVCRVAVVAGLFPLSAACIQAQEPLAAWRTPKVTPATTGAHHSIHAYFNSSPESPDGRWVLYYASTTANGEEGEICIQERASGKVRTLARGVATEDAHRAACQQWVSGGKRVVFHNLLASASWCSASGSDPPVLPPAWTACSGPLPLPEYPGESDVDGMEYDGASNRKITPRKE